MRFPSSSRRAHLLLALCALAWAIAACAQSPAVPGSEWMQLKSPQQAGWSREKLDGVHAFVVEIGSTSAMIVQHGVVVAAWGDIAHRCNLHSCRKSLLDALIGNAVAGGKINLDDSLEKLGIDDKKPSLSAEEKQATVRDLLEARSGVYHVAAYETKGMEENRPERGSHPHGTFWFYNNWDFNTLGFIYEKAVGEKIFDAFCREIAQPIGMQDFKPHDGHYVSVPESRYPAYLFDMSARDFARFALLYLRGGKWNGAQVVPEDWVRASTHPYSDTHSGGYGYLWWTGASASGAPGQIAFPADSFWAEGHLGQFAVVVPGKDLVIVNRVDGEETKRVVSKSQMAKLLRLVLEAAPAN
jgi:CubicO group peptidase (beta-lactamase class C family)